VTGKVTFKGAPLPGGTVTFIPQDDKATSSSSIIQSDGTYRIVNIQAGDVKITVQGPGRPSNPSDKTAEVAIPARYQDGMKSGLSYTVKQGSQTKDIDLTP